MPQWQFQQQLAEYGSCLNLLSFLSFPNGDGEWYVEWVLGYGCQ